MIPLEEKVYIKAQIIKTIKGQTNLYELSKFINYLRKLINNHIYLNKSTFLYYVSNFGLDANDISIEVLSELFIKNQNEEFITLLNFSNNLNQSIEEIKPESLFLSFMGLVRKITDTIFARTFIENDKIGAKIARNIRSHLPNEQLELFFFCGEYYIKQKFSNNESLPYLDFEEFKSSFLSLEIENLSIPNLLSYLSDSLNKLEQYRKEIRFIEAIIIFKEIYLKRNFENEKITSENEYFIVNDISTTIDLEILKEKCLKLVRSKLFEYLSKNRYNAEQIQAIYLTMNDILKDLLYNGGFQKSFYEYLKKYYDITNEHYNSEFKTKVEYLSKIIRNEIIDYINN